MLQRLLVPAGEWVKDGWISCGHGRQISRARCKTIKVVHRVAFSAVTPSFFADNRVESRAQ